jgi:hypothetical protein
MDVLPFCDLFLTRVALRLIEADQVDRSSAKAPEIAARIVTVSPSKPGVGYVMLDGHREPVGVRAATSPDEVIAGSRPLRLAARPAGTLEGGRRILVATASLGLPLSL